MVKRSKDGLLRYKKADWLRSPHTLGAPPAQKLRNKGWIVSGLYVPKFRLELHDEIPDIDLQLSFCLISSLFIQENQSHPIIT